MKENIDLLAVMQAGSATDVTAEDVVEVADALVSEGETPSIGRICEILGTYKAATVHKHLRAWRDARRKPVTPTVSEEIPEMVRTVYNKSIADTINTVTAELRLELARVYRHTSWCENQQAFFYHCHFVTVDGQAQRQHAACFETNAPLQYADDLTIVQDAMAQHLGVESTALVAWTELRGGARPDVEGVFKAVLKDHG